MAEITKELGRIPVSRGNYQATTEYYKDNIVQYKRGSYQVVSESPIIGIPPTNDKNIVNPGWTLFAGTLDAQNVVNQIKEQETKSIQAVAAREAEILAKSDASKISSSVTGLEGSNVEDKLTNASNKLSELETKVIYDVSAHNDGAVFESLLALLSSSSLDTLIPTSVRRGGMSIKFIQSSNSKYVQYFLIKKEWSVAEEDWEKVNIEEELNNLDKEVRGLPEISFEATLKPYQYLLLDSPIKAGRAIKNNSPYIVYVYNNTTELQHIPVGATRTYDVDVTKFRASDNEGVYNLNVLAVPSSVIPEIVNDYTGGTNKTLSAEIGKELNKNLQEDILSPFIFRRSHGSIRGLVQINTLSFKAGYSYCLSAYTDEIVSESNHSYIQIYNGDTLLMQALIKAGTTFGQSNIIQVTEDLNNLVLKAGVEKPFTYEIKAIINSGTFMGDDVVGITQLKDYAEETLLLDEYYSGSDTDYSSMIEEIYIPSEYRNNIDYVSLYNYNNKVVLNARTNYGALLWSSSILISQNTPNGSVLQTAATTGDAVVYVVMKDVNAFIAAGTDIGNGQGVNLKLAYKLFTQDKIRHHIKQYSSIYISDNYINSNMLNDKCVTLKKLGDGTSLAKGVRVILPDNIYAVVGDCLQIFYRSIINSANPYIYDIIAVSSKGKSYPRYWIYTPSVSDIGTTATLTIKVRDNEQKVIAEKTTTLHFIDTCNTPSKNINLLCIGASNTTGGHWVGELNRRLTTNTGDGNPSNPTGLNLGNITFVGRKTGAEVNIPLEATGGWKIASYASQGERALRFQVSGISQLIIGDTYNLNGGVFVIQEINITEGSGNIRCTLNSSLPTIPSSGTLNISNGSGDSTIEYSSYVLETYSPFWNDNTNKLDFASYANSFCNGVIDIMIWHCGTNDIFSGFDTNIDIAISGYIDILRQFHVDFPNGKVILSSIPIASITGGFGANYGASEYYNSFTFANQAHKFAERLIELCNDDEFSSYTEYCPSLETYDSENCYPTTDSPVNHRSSTTEKLGTNGVHYTTNGQYLIADAIYHSVNKILS